METLNHLLKVLGEYNLVPGIAVSSLTGNSTCGYNSGRCGQLNPDTLFGGTITALSVITGGWINPLYIDTMSWNPYPTESNLPLLLAMYFPEEDWFIQLQLNPKKNRYSMLSTLNIGH